jgi:hypothetical protein
MIPIQTFLALIFALTLMSCSQEPPPGMRQKGAGSGPVSNSKDGPSGPSPSVSPSASPTSSSSGSSSVPSGTSSSAGGSTAPGTSGAVSDDPSFASLESLAMKRPGKTHWRWDKDVNTQTLTWTFVGQDAQRLFWYTQAIAKKETQVFGDDTRGTQSEAWVKETPHYRCQKFIRPKLREFYACSLRFHLETFAVQSSVGSQADVKKIETDSEPLLVEDEEQGEFIKFFKNSDKKSPFFQIWFLGNKAQELYGMIPRSEGPSKFKSGGLRRFGEHLTCENAVDPKAASGTSPYYCILFGNLSLGVFDTIQP